MDSRSLNSNISLPGKVIFVINLLKMSSNMMSYSAKKLSGQSMVVVSQDHLFI
jgi:hypothetical protein